MPVDPMLAPTLHAVLLRHATSKLQGRRIVLLDEPDALVAGRAESVARELRVPGVVPTLSAGEFAVLATAAVATRRSIGDDFGMVEALGEALASHPSRISADVVLAAFGQHGRHRSILACFPGLVGSPAMIDALAEGLVQKHFGDLHSMVDVDELVIRDPTEARRVLPASQAHAADYVPTYVVAAMARGMGWIPWVRLFGILFDSRELVHLDAPERPPVRNQYERPKALRARAEAWASIAEGDPARSIARLMLDLEEVGTLAEPDTWGVFAARLEDAVGGSAEFRQAAVEALLWKRPSDRRDLALYVATRLVTDDDREFIDGLIDHPDRNVGYEAQMVRDAVFGVAEEHPVRMRPMIVGVPPDRLLLGSSAGRDEGEPLTWIGDRLLERLIEQTVDEGERRFASEYPDHSEEGEEGLLRILFSELAVRFRHLNDGLRAIAPASRSATSAGVSLDYRPVDKAEEGKAGVHRDGGRAPPDFSADVCLIVDPYLDGRSLGKRATLVQAKRLRLREPERSERGYAASFRLDPGQIDDLVRQTASSHYLFQCGGLRGRGVPMMPARLVDDLARRHAPTRAQIPADLVGPASRSFADWLTYDLLALRTGDPFAELVAKAEGGPGRRPRPLARLGTVEIVVRVAEPSSR